jgi:hypothetical protein
LLVALIVPLAAGSVAATASGVARVDGPGARPSAEFVRSGQRAACVGLRNQITYSAVFARAAAWMATHEDRYDPALWQTRLRSVTVTAGQEQRVLDRYGSLFLRTYGPKALGGCVTQERHASTAARELARFVCRAEKKVPQLAVAVVGGDLYRTDFGTRHWLGPCMKERASSAAVTRLAEAQVAAATTCHARLAAGARAAFGACVLAGLREP